jgi:Rrf2 family transcriptional regulator, nitric oxide-sensitive transcriptional repressor
MRVTLQTDYSLRVLMYAATKGERLSRIDEIAKSFGISKNHLMKVVYELGKSGYLETIRGRNGGIRLMRKPSQINIGTVVRETEKDLSMLGCLAGVEGFCCVEQICVLRRAFRDASQAFIAVLDRYTVEDLIKPKATLAKLLQIDTKPRAA